MDKLQNYAVYPISENEIGFRTKANVLYDVYFYDKSELLSYQVCELYPKLSLFELGFDRFMIEKNHYDSKIADTILHIIHTFNWRNRIVYSRVYNPVGQHDVLNRLYIKLLREKTIRFVPFSVQVRTEFEDFIMLAFYSEDSGISLHNFIEVIYNTISNNLKDYTISLIEIYNVINTKHIEPPIKTAFNIDL